VPLLALPLIVIVTTNADVASPVRVNVNALVPELATVTTPIC
jgi:hypothetical protein